MKKTYLSLFLFWFAFLAAAYPQRNGTVEGRLINGTNPSKAPGSVELDLVELGSGMNVIKTATTDAAGRFKFQGISESGRLMIRAIYKDVNYYSQFSMDGSGRANVELEVYEPTTSMDGIKVESAGMAFQIAGDQLQSVETVTFNNVTKPPRTLMNPEGNFRFSKAAGIAELPKMRVTAPGSQMPVMQAALESPDGQSYYSQYPLKPGITTFEVQQILPYANRNYTYTGKFYHDISTLDVGVSPADLVVTGTGLSKVSVDSTQNFAIYRISPVKSGSEFSWTFSGGTPLAPANASAPAETSSVESVPDIVGRNALVIGPLLLAGFVVGLWAAFNKEPKGKQKAVNSRSRELKERREQLLNAIADLDHRKEIQAIDQREFVKQREENKRQLRRISLLLKM